MKIEAQTLAALLLLGTITACDNASTGGDTIIENPLVVDDPTGQDDAGLDDNTGGDNAGDDAPDVEDNQDDPPPILEGNVLREVTVDPGDETALATVQAALDQALPGDKITIAAGVYHETAKTGDSETLKGLMVKVSGTAENPIIIEGELAGDTLATVIDQQKTTFDHEQPVVGIYLDCVQHVIIRNLRIQNVNQAGITSPLQGCPTEYLNIENVYINNVFGAEKTAGVRLLNAANVVVSKVVIDNVQSSAKLSQAMAMQASEMQSEQNPLQSGSVSLVNNTVSNVQQGIRLTAQGESVIDGVTINRNRITKAHDAITMEAVGEQAAKIVDVALRDNVINQVNRAVVVAANASVLVDDLSITNNTIVEASGEAALVFKGATGVQVYNNLFSVYQKVVSSSITDGGSLNEFTYWDYNAYWEPEQPVQWTLAQGHPQYERFWANFKTWQDDKLGSEEMRNAPDGNSHDDLAPAFEDNDYKLAVDSPLRQAGRRGEAIGASRE